MVSLLSLGALFVSAAAFITPSCFIDEPENDPFYDAPSNLDSLANGEVYDSRLVFDSIFVDATLAVVEQVAYKTLNTQNQSSHSVVTVISPLFAAENAGVLSYQTFEDAANLDCSISYNLVTHADGWDKDVTIAIQTMVSKGHYVFLPDYEGARSGFGAGHEQGQAGLDGIRAGINHLCLDKDVSVALQGYGAGGSATVWMASLAGAYAPDLNIVGAAHGGTSVDLGKTIKYVDEQCNLFSGLTVPALAGLLNSYPDVEEDISSNFDSDFQNALNQTRSPGFCLGENVAEFQFQDWHSKMGIDFYTYPSTVEMLKNESLLCTESATTVPVPTFPHYIYHAEGDEVTPFAPVDQYVQEQCASGANIKFVKWCDDDHLTVQYVGFLDALKFSLEVLEGVYCDVPCGTDGVDILTWKSWEIGGILGEPVALMIDVTTSITTPLGTVITDFTAGYAE